MTILYVYAFFIIYAFLGWVCEDLYCGIPVKKFINRGFLYGPYCPIYGIGALFVIYPLLKVRSNPLVVFLAGVFITSTLEYITSWVLEKMFHIRWWDYSQYRYNIHGRVCLLNSTLFGCMTLFVIYILHPRISKIIFSIPISTLCVLETLFTLGFLTDEFLTIRSLLKRKQVLEKLHEELENKIHELEKERKERLEEWSEDILEWLDSLPNLLMHIPELTFHLPDVERLKKQRISRAFPKQKWNKNYIKNKIRKEIKKR
ncbi:MAG: putative ABC transporter permease [Bacillota bacterium]|nr:putative ABC transporter permease [Bacillota bacterium]